MTTGTDQPPRARVRPVHLLYRKSDWVHMYEKLSVSGSDCDAKVMRLAERIPPKRRLLKFGAVPNQAFFSDVRVRFPHMREPIELFSDMAALSTVAHTGYRVPPVLLEGPAGIGKTALAQSLAKAIGARMEVIDMAAVSAGFAISGSHPSWSAAKQGCIFDLLTDTAAVANPVVVLDELDKVGGEKRYDPCGPLYSLLEPVSARAFKDEFIPLPIDASAIIWIATCNRATDVPGPIRSRFDIYSIDNPTTQGWASIARSIWSDLMEAEPLWAKILAPTLAENVIARLIQLGDAREISRVLVRAAARAAKAGRTALISEDVPPSRQCGSRRHPIGFT